MWFIHPYNYTENNPIRNIDPDGMLTQTYEGEEAQDIVRWLQISSQDQGGDDKKKKNKEDQHGGDNPVPDEYKQKGLPGFPGSQRLKKKKGAREAWDIGGTYYLPDIGKKDKRKIPKGWWDEWDRQHGEVEVYNKQGEHQGAWDPESGEENEGKKDKSRNPTYNRFSSEEPDGGKTIIQKGFQFPQIAPPPPGTAAKSTAMGATLTLLALIFMLAGG